MEERQGEGSRKKQPASISADASTSACTRATTFPKPLSHFHSQLALLTPGSTAPAPEKPQLQGEPAEVSGGRGGKAGWGCAHPATHREGERGTARHPLTPAPRLYDSGSKQAKMNIFTLSKPTACVLQTTVLSGLGTERQAPARVTGSSPTCVKGAGEMGGRDLNRSQSFS